MAQESLLNQEFITTYLTGPDTWTKSHGSENGSADLAAGMLYYSLAYSLKARTCVNLGSGGGFVPRMMRQAQRDLHLEPSRTILIDGGEFVPQAKKDIWGTPTWLPEDSWLRTNFPDIEIMIGLTEKMFYEYFLPNHIQIDYLHIDADHHYEGVKLDWDLYSTLVPYEGVITLHDTVNYRPPCGVPQLVQEIREEGKYSVINFPIKYGTAIVKRNPVRG